MKEIKFMMNFGFILAFIALILSLSNFLNLKHSEKARMESFEALTKDVTISKIEPFLNSSDYGKLAIAELKANNEMIATLHAHLIKLTKSNKNEFFIEAVFWVLVILLLVAIRYRVSNFVTTSRASKNE